VATDLKKTFDTTYGGTWHCVVGDFAQKLASCEHDAFIGRCKLWQLDHSPNKVFALFPARPSSCINFLQRRPHERHWPCLERMCFRFQLARFKAEDAGNAEVAAAFPVAYGVTRQGLLPLAEYHQLPPRQGTVTV